MKSEHIYVDIRNSSLGSVLIAQSETGVCAIFIGDDHDMLRADLRARFPKITFVPYSSSDQRSRLDRIARDTVSAIESPNGTTAVPMDVRGTNFQKQVWSELQRIPLGSTASYGEIAQSIGKPTSYRAVAQACASNKVAVLIPCHRVVRSDGNLSGYRWGIEIKRTLLQRENAI